MRPRFYTPDKLQPGEFVLKGPEAHHLAVVRRVRTGDFVALFNGDGHEYPAQVIALAPKQVVLNVQSVENPQRERPMPLEMAVAMPKGDRADFLVEKLVELGVTRLTPLMTFRTIVRPRPSRLDHLRQAVIEACKQCGRNILMRIDELTTWAEYLHRPDLPSQRILLSPHSPNILCSTREAVVCAIGPEGGWEEKEIVEALELGWKLYQLGPRTLRVETAAIAAAAILAS